MASGAGRTRIAELLAWEALDSRGSPTVACEVRLTGGAWGAATMPSGKSTGSHEAVELRDGGERYGGLGVRRAVANVTGPLAEAVRGLDAADQAGLDAALRLADGTPGLARLGANAVLAVSVAAALAAAAATGRPLYRAAAGPDGPGREGEVLLPLPMVNVISGGAHAGGAFEVQDLLVVPLGAASFAEAIEWASRVRRATAAAMEARGMRSALVADEGGLGPVPGSNRAALELLVEGLERSGLVPGTEVGIAIDLAATELWSAGDRRYVLGSEGRSLDASELLEELASWVAEAPILSLEDPMAEDDWEGWRAGTSRWSGLQVVGDDLLATDPGRLERAVRSEVANAVLVKPNQNGTLSGAREFLERARGAGYATVCSARSGETEDSWLADLAVAWRAGQVKVGSTTRSERNAKWNRLLRIEAEAGDRARFAGGAALAPGSRGLGGFDRANSSEVYSLPAAPGRAGEER